MLHSNSWYETTQNRHRIIKASRAWPTYNNKFKVYIYIYIYIYIFVSYLNIKGLFCWHSTRLADRKFRVSPPILKTFYSGAIESVLTQRISVWYGNGSCQDCKDLQRVVCLAERISGSALPSLQDIYLKCCKSRAAKITKDSNHPGNHLFILLPSGKRFCSMMAKTERFRRSFFPQAIRLLNSNSVS